MQVPIPPWIVTATDISALGYARVGSGEPLLLLHGFGSTPDDFAGLVPSLADYFEVWSVDLPGHGASPMMARRPSIGAITAEVEAHLDAHGLSRVHVLGNSLGARVAIGLARAGRALSVVAISPSGMVAPAERIYQGALMMTARGMNQIRRPWMEELASTVAGRATLLAGLRAMPWLASPREALTMRGGFAEQHGFWDTLWNGIMFDIPVGLNQIQCPVIVAQGSLDVVGARQSPRFAAAIPGARFVLLPGGGHAPQSDTPGLIIDLVRDAATQAATCDRPTQATLVSVAAS